MRKGKFNITLTPTAKALIQVIANEDGLSPSAAIEELIRREARRRKVRPPKDSESMGLSEESSTESGE